MSRPLRIQYPGAWYHVMSRGRRGEVVFSEEGDFLVFIELLKETVEMWKVRVGAYCLMPNHYHLLIQTPYANLSRCMRHLNGIYTQRFNRSHNCDGQLFRGRYKSILVDADSYLLELVRYIHRNPVEAGVVDELYKWAWSSHEGYISGSKKWDWLHKNFILTLFSADKREGIKKYKEFISTEAPEEINHIFAGSKWPSVLGSEGFTNKAKGKFFNKELYEEVPESRSLAPAVERIKEVVCRAYNAENDDLLLSKRGVFNEPRDMAIYLVRRFRGEKLKDIGREFNMDNYSSVSSAIERMKKGISQDRKLRNRVEELEASLTN